MNSSYNPLVTFFIPSYNHIKYVEQSIISVCEQTYQNLDVIVIDDGSIDGSHELISKLQEKYNFKYIHRPNKGLIRTLNEALEIAQGEYFCWGGSDDIFIKDKVEKQVKFFEKNPEYALCYGKMIFIDGNDKTIKEAKTKHNKSGYVFDDLIYRCFITLPTVMVKTDILKEFGFDTNFFLEDYPLWLKIAKKYKIGFLDEILTYYRLHDTNVSNDLNKMIIEVNRILDEWKNDPIYPNAIAKWYYRWFCDLSKHNNLELSKKYMIKAFSKSFYKPRYIKCCIRYFLKAKLAKK